MVTSTPLSDDATDATAPRYDAEVVRYDDAPDECTISPVETAGAELLTTWISAQERSYVDLATMR
jgi:hypothetical protein